MTYEKFLENKQLAIINSGFEIKHEQISQVLFDYQKDLVRWAIKKGKAALFVDTGLGKTLMQLEFARLIYEKYKKPILILAPLAVSYQTIQEGKNKLGIDIKYIKSTEEICESYNITNYERLEKLDVEMFNCIVLDECFAPDTQIQVYREKKLLNVNIKDCKIGDNVINCNGLDKITGIKRRKIDYAIKIKFNGKEVISSGKHPYFTQRGWVAAKNIQKDDFIIASDKAMRILRGEFSDNIQGRFSEKILREVLLCEMENEPTGNFGKSSYERSSSKNREEEIGMVQNSSGSKRTEKNSGIKSDVKSDNKAKGITNIESNETPTFSAWGKWERDDITAAINEGCFVRELDSGICYIFGETSKGLSDKLQSGLIKLGEKNCDRNRWSITSLEERTGQEEGRKTGYFRVESFEVLEQTDNRLDKYRDETGSLYFYDLEIERHPSFTINECLVHNSSILKSFTGKTRDNIIEKFNRTPYKLACSATPAPNDYMELGNHSEFLNDLSFKEMLAMYFVHDGGDTSKWRLKGHAKNKFWEWLATWAAVVRKPSDLGYDSKRFDLPELKIHHITADTEGITTDTLFATQAKTLQEKRAAKKGSLNDRVELAAEIANGIKDPVLIWCDYNEESDKLKKICNDSIEITGSDKSEHKEKYMLEFAKGTVKTLISKASICGFGMNFQVCNNMIFVGMNDSFESYYQAIRRCWRFGQTKEVNVYIITSKQEAGIVENIEKKEKFYKDMMEEVVKITADIVKQNLQGELKVIETYNPKIRMVLPKWI